MNRKTHLTTQKRTDITAKKKKTELENIRTYDNVREIPACSSHKQNVQFTC